MAVSATTTPLVMIYSVFLFIFLLNPSSFSMAAKTKKSKSTSVSAESHSILLSGETLASGDSLRYGTYAFTMQNDCNLVLYDGTSEIWSSNTKGLASNCYLTMQFDGNLVIYKPDRSALWASNTQRENGNYILILQKDRNVVVYGGAIWNTVTYVSNSKRAGGTNGVSIKNLPAPIIYSDGAKIDTGLHH